MHVARSRKCNSFTEKIHTACIFVVCDCCITKGIKNDVAYVFLSRLAILFAGEGHLEVRETFNRCRYFLSLSFLHSDTWRLSNRVLFLQLKKGKLHGCIDVGLSVMSIKKKAMCIDLDTEDNIFHLKVPGWGHLFGLSVWQSLNSACSTQVKSQELFEEWVSKLRHHRVFRQNEIATYPHERHLLYPHSSPSLSESMKKVGYS